MKKWQFEKTACQLEKNAAEEDPAEVHAPVQLEPFQEAGHARARAHSLHCALSLSNVHPCRNRKMAGSSHLLLLPPPS